MGHETPKLDEPRGATASSETAENRGEPQDATASGTATSADGEELGRIETLYEAGDFRSVNHLAGALSERPTDDVVKERAKTLASRVQIDPFVLWVWAGTTVLVFGLVYAFVLR
ncbi:MAG: hypothetical protein HYY06_30350 [Deltaproteobacteria bacterium]|nr:hypothetical protein [Deltaproteobacteria bacterium]